MFLYRENSPLPQVPIPDIARGIPVIVAVTLFEHPAAALYLFPQATLSRDTFYFSESQKRTFYFPFFVVYSLDCELDEKREWGYIHFHIKAFWVRGYLEETLSLKDSHVLSSQTHQVNCQSDKQNDMGDTNWNDISSISSVVPAGDISLCDCNSPDRMVGASCFPPIKIKHKSYVDNRKRTTLSVSGQGNHFTCCEPKTKDAETLCNVSFDLFFIVK